MLDTPFEDYESSTLDHAHVTNIKTSSVILVQMNFASDECHDCIVANQPPLECHTPTPSHHLSCAELPPPPQDPNKHVHPKTHKLAIMLNSTKCP